MKKKILTAILAVSMLLGSVYCVCGAQTEENTEKTVNPSYIADDTSNSLKDKVVDGRSLNSAKTLLGYLVGLCTVEDDEKNLEETSERKIGKCSKDTVNLDNYVYEYSNELSIQVIDNDRFYEVLEELEETLGIDEIKIKEYDDRTDTFNLELPVLVTREITAKILNNENVTYAAPPIIRIYPEEPIENKREKFSKDTINLDNYVYEYNNELSIQVIDDKRFYEVLEELEKTLGIYGIKSKEYDNLTDTSILELPVLVTREITEKILSNENVTYAAPTILKDRSE